MVVGIESDIFEVIMFTPCTYTFLSVRSPVERGFLIAQEEGHELIHAGVGEE
jgi:hypothetical protein